LIVTFEESELINFVDEFVENSSMITDAIKIKDSKVHLITKWASLSFTVEADNKELVIDISSANLKMIGSLFGKVRNIAGNMLIKKINKLPLSIKARKHNGNVYLNINNANINTIGVLGDKFFLDVTFV
jgi:hypothetical protein